MDSLGRILTPILRLAEAYIRYPLVIIVQSANESVVVCKYLAKGRPPTVDELPNPDDPVLEFPLVFDIREWGKDPALRVELATWPKTGKAKSRGGAKARSGRKMLQFPTRL